MSGMAYFLVHGSIMGSGVRPHYLRVMIGLKHMCRSLGLGYCY